MNGTHHVPNILIVDDLSANLAMLTEIIKSAGYIARPVHNVKQAIKELNSQLPSMIILDVSLPGTDGFEFCAMLKKNPVTRNIPVIFISAFDSPEARIKGLKLGAVDFIAKPFEIEEVILRIRTHMKLYKKQQNLESYNKKLFKIISEHVNQIYEEQKIML